jgi:2-dehydro-3-deoxy-D-arabinonate dehydratase
VHIIRYRARGSGDAVIGVLADGHVTALDKATDLASLWKLTVAELRELLSAPATAAAGPALADIELLPPVDGRTEVWAAGVTYEISRAARVEESEQSADVYERVYDAPRPELFFKSAGWRVVGDGGPIAIRADSTLDVPEPEVALVLNAHGEVAGYTICNDVSSRSIEGENPLYLPQAKVYLGGCALGPAIRPAWEVADPYALSIGITILRSGAAAWQGTASTAQLHRRYDELVSCLLEADFHPDGVILSTGTCLVPPAPFSLQPDDVVRIEVSELGTLTNPVVRGLAAMRSAMRAACG